MSNRIKNIASNRKAYFEYSIIEKLEAGISLTGTEVKSVRDGKVNLKGSFVNIVNGEVFLQNCHIAEYERGSFSNNQGISVDENPLEDMGNKEQEKIEVSEKEG